MENGQHNQADLKKRKQPKYKHFVLYFFVLVCVVFFVNDKMTTTSIENIKTSTSTISTTTVYSPIILDDKNNDLLAKELQVFDSSDNAPVVVPVKKPAYTLDYTVGISVGETLTVLSNAELKSELDDIVSLGIGWIRVDFSWSSIQPHNSSEYLWEKNDRIVAEANKRNIKVLPILAYTPYWARSSVCKETNKCAPNRPEEFGEFARVVVERYAQKGVHTYEIWNEPNMRLFWKPGADPKYYVRLLKASYTKMHVADPKVTVIAGALAVVSTKTGSFSPREFLEKIYEYGGGPYFDAISFHPYTFPLTPSDYKDTNAWSQIAGTDWSLRSIMAKNGDSDKKIWLTEFGAPTGGPGTVADVSGGKYIWNTPDHVTEKYQAEIFESAIKEVKKTTWNGPLFLYSYKDLGTSQNTKENHFGILRYDGTKKPSYYVIKNLLLGV